MYEMDESDEEILVGSSERPELFVVFYDRHVAALLRFFVARTMDAETAADLTSETIVEAYASRANFKGARPGAGAAWLFAIASHKLNRFIRRRVVDRRARRKIGFEVAPPSGDDLERIEALIDFELVGRQVAKAFGSLPPRQKQALLLRVVEGRPYSEIARLLACSRQVVRARVSRGLRRMATQIGELG